MTIEEAIQILKIESVKYKKDFYDDRRKAVEIAIQIMQNKIEEDKYGIQSRS